MGDDSDRDLHLPPGGDPVAVAVVLHPHPAMGGDRHHPLVVALAEGLAGVGVAALRPSLTDPSFPAGADALATIAKELRAEVGVDRLFLLGYSWGSVVTALAEVDDVAARVLVAPPVSHVDLPTQTAPALVLVPAHDQYGPPDDVRAAFAPWPDATVEVVDGCDHFVVGATGRITDRAVAWLTALIQIRRADQAEATLIGDLYWRAREAAVPAIPPSVHPRDDVLDYFATVMLPHRDVWVADEDGAVIGLLVLEPGWVDHLYLEPSRTGEGVGSQLLDHAKQVQPDGLDLWAFRSNTGARRFYERHGFVAVAFTEGDNEEGEPDVRYHWDG